jgi:hypothetical protein
MEQRSSGATTAGLIAVVGGLLAVIGSFLTWVHASYGRFAVSVKGVDRWQGKATMVLGVLLLVAGITAFTKGFSDPTRRRGLFGGVVVVGVGIAGVAIYAALIAKDRVIDAAAGLIVRRLGVPLDQARTAAKQAVNSGVLKIALDIGLYMVIAGGVLGIVAGLLAMGSKPAAPAMPAPASEMGLRGWAAQAPPTPLPTPPPGNENMPAPTGSAPSSWTAQNPAPPPPSGPPAPPSAPPEPPPSDPGGGQAPT